MTDQQLRELDAYLAEHAMGWKNATDKQVFCPGDFWIGKGSGDVMRCIVGPNGYYMQQDWHPTQNPADAMAVLKKCAEKCDAEIRIYQSELVLEDRGLLWFVDSGNTITDRQNMRGYGETLELAICKFAQQLWNAQ